MRSIVVGAGVAGLSCAYELSELGHEVTVVDAGSVGAGASAGNAGWVTPFLSSPRAAPGAVGDGLRSFTTRGGPARVRPRLEPAFAGFITRFVLASRARRHTRSVAALQKLAGQALAGFDSLLDRGVSFEHYTAGLAVVFAETAGLKHYDNHLVPRMRRLGYVGDTRTYRGAEIPEFDPAIRRDLAGVLHFQHERHVRPETLTQGLAKALLANDGVVVENEAVTRIEPRPVGTWTVTTEQGRVLESEQLVLAAGFPTRSLLRQVGVRLPMEAAKGTSLTAQGTGTAPRHPLKFYESMVACSPFGSSVRLSGTFDLGVRDHQLNPKRLNDAVLGQGLTYLHDWRPDQVETRWVGHRPTTADDLPVIGPVHGHRGLYLCTGHGTLGVTLGPVTAALAAREITGQGAEPLLEPFRLSRF